MKIYIASSFKNKHEVRKYIRLLTEAGHTVVTDWTVHVSTTSLTKLGRDAVIDLAGVRECDKLVLVWPGRYGSAGELAAALVLGKQVIAVGAPREARLSWIYLNHPNVSHVANSIELLRDLAHETNSAPDSRSFCDECAVLDNRTDSIQARREANCQSE